VTVSPAALSETIAKVRALARALRLWVLELVAVLAAQTDWSAARVWVRQETLAFRHDARAVLMALVALEVTRRGVLRRDPSPRRGLRAPFWSRRSIRRFSLRGIRLDTLDCIRRVLDALDTAIERGVRNVRDATVVRQRQRRRVPLAADARLPVARAIACTREDSS
jgi:hypothetical protein